MALFEITSGGQTQELAGGHLQLTARPARMIVAKRKAQLEQLVQDYFAGDEDVHFVSHGDWNLFDLFNLSLPQMQGPCCLWLSTYSMYEFPLRQILLAQQEGSLQEVNMVIDSRARIRSESSIALAKNIANKLALKACHAKCMIMQNEQHSMCVVGSQNWTKNPRIEIGFISRSRELAGFHMTWMQKTLEGTNAFE